MGKEEKYVVSKEAIKKAIEDIGEKEEMPKIDWDTAKNALTFIEYMELRKKYGMEG